MVNQKSLKDMIVVDVETSQHQQLSSTTIMMVLSWDYRVES